MKKIEGVSFFCPAYYDAQNISHVVTKAVELFSELCDDYEIVVVNDGSPDNTREVLDAKRATLTDK
jgi:glycosyltransferase involved in cell wall biosynthesis